MVLRSVVHKISQECQQTYLQDQLLLSPFMHVSPRRSITCLWQDPGHWISLWETVRFLSSPRSNWSWFQNLWKSAWAFSVVTVRRPRLTHWAADEETGGGGESHCQNTPTQTCMASCIYAHRNGRCDNDSWNSSSAVGLVEARFPGQRSGSWHQRNIQGGGSKVTRYPAPDSIPHGY